MITYYCNLIYAIQIRNRIVFVLANQITKRKLNDFSEINIKDAIFRNF